MAYRRIDLQICGGDIADVHTTVLYFGEKNYPVPCSGAKNYPAARHGVSKNHVEVQNHFEASFGEGPAGQLSVDTAATYVTSMCISSYVRPDGRA
jgi:hypothetical protein